MSNINREELLAELYKHNLMNSEISEIVNGAAETERHGYWIDGYTCSVCGYPVPTDTTLDGIDTGDNLYCYHCGARMDEVLG